ncbi:MAG: hypothetical protein ACKVX7_10730 [Planctomycetota bacterium]
MEYVQFISPCKILGAMKVLEIHDIDGGRLAFDLHAVLLACGQGVLVSTWRLFNVESFGLANNAVHEISDSARPVTGFDLLKLSEGLHQTVDGKFEATFPDADEPWLVILAIDSTLFEVHTDSTQVLAEIQSRFADVRFRAESV